MEELLLRADDVAKVLNLGRSKVFEMIAKKELPSISIGRCRRVPVRALERWIEERTTEAEGRVTV